MNMKNGLAFRRELFLRVFLILFLLGTLCQSRAAINADCSGVGNAGDAECNGVNNASRTNPCIQEVCTEIGTGVFRCKSAGFDLTDQACLCSDCGNGVCEQDAGEDTDTCPADCSPMISLAPLDVCLAKSCDPNTFDLCCPAGCEGTDPNLGNFDKDCACELSSCGNGTLDSPEETCDDSASPDPACRPPGDTNECTSCGDGFLQSPVEECEVEGADCNTIADNAPGICSSCGCRSN